SGARRFAYLDGHASRGPAHGRVHVRRCPVRDRPPSRSGELLPLHALPAPDGHSRVSAGSCRAGFAQGAPGLRAGQRVPAARPVLFVGNSEDGTVTLVDAHRLRVIGHLNAIPDGNTPQDPAQAAIYPLIVAAKGVNYVQGLAVSPNGRTLYISRGYLGDVAAFRIADGHELWRLQINGIRADHVALAPDGSRLFVSALTANEVQVIDTRTHSFVGAFPTGDWPHVLEFAPHGYIWNGSLGNQLEPSGHDGRKQLTMADPRTLQV